jgi:hypothetical protein
MRGFQSSILFNLSIAECSICPNYLHETNNDYRTNEPELQDTLLAKHQ